MGLQDRQVKAVHEVRLAQQENVVLLGTVDYQVRVGDLAHEVKMVSQEDLDQADQREM